MDLSPLVQIFERLSNDNKIELAHTFPVGKRECPITIQNCISLLNRAKKCGMYSSDEKLIRSFLHKNDALYLESHLSNEQTTNLNSFLEWFVNLGYHSTRSRKHNYFLKKAFKESTQDPSEGCQTLWLRLVSDYKEAYMKTDDLDERDKEKIIEVYLRALRSDRVRRKLKAQYDLLHFEWERKMSFARQARFFEEEEKDLMADGGTNEILNYLKDKLNLTNCGAFSHKRRSRYRDRSDSRDSYFMDHEENRNRDRNRRERSDSRGRVRYRSSNRYSNERSHSRGRDNQYQRSSYRHDSSQSHNDRYRDSSRYHNIDNNDGHYRSSRNNNQNRYGRDQSPNHDYRFNRVRHLSDDNLDYQGN